MLISVGSNVTIESTTFRNNSAIVRGRGILQCNKCNITISRSRTIGGVVYSLSSNVAIEASIFHHNTAYDAGVLYVKGGRIEIKNCAFHDNGAMNRGGVLYSIGSTIAINDSKFTQNGSPEGASNLGGVVHSTLSNISTETRVFHYSIVRDGGVLSVIEGTIEIRNCAFRDNRAMLRGGALYAQYSIITIYGSNFTRTRSPQGVVIFVLSGSGGSTLDGTRVEIKYCVFDGNSATRLGGVLFSLNTIIAIDNSNFTQNRAPEGAVIYAVLSSIMHHSNIVYDNNSAGVQGVIALHQSVLNQKYSNTSMTFSNNLGSVTLFNSNITLCGQAMFFNNTRLGGATDGFQEGGTITLFQSNVNFNGVSHFIHNSAENGGAIHSMESKLYVNGNVTIAHNTATRNGGGVYLSNSELNCHQKSTFELINNEARHKGGGVHAISSSINAAFETSSILGRMYRTRAYSGTTITFTENTAERGGGVALEANAKLYILKYNATYDRPEPLDINTLFFTANRAVYGGAIYVDDDTNSGTCFSDTSSECFFQVLAVYAFAVIENRYLDLRTQCVYFSQNYANISGSTLYGGLLDRCIVSQFTEVNYKYQLSKGYRDGNAYFKNVSTIDHALHVPQELSSATNTSISSLPVRVCLCTNNEHDIGKCNNKTSIEVKKGHEFTLSVVAVDQVGQPVDAIIQAALRFTKRAKSGLVEGQPTRDIISRCTNLTFNVVSSQRSEILTLHALDGPCKDVELSVTAVKIHFLPCDCPIGLQVSGTNSTNCTCECHDDIKQHMEQCNSNGSLIKQPQSRAWISYVNHTEPTGYLIYDNCPFDYCLSTNPPFHLDQPNGADAQCAFKRSSLLCGSCQPGLSLSLGSSSCLSCPTYWPAVLVAITTAAILAGIALVALLLVLNMTVATGTLNGLIFYSNVVYANKSILLPFKTNNFITVFISWMNLELGIDTCYFPGMDTYIRTWLQLAFPAYVILLVVTVIIISSKSTKFSDIIGKKDPVATLATLVLLSYTKLLEICFKSLSAAVLYYPDGTSQPLWLSDGTVRYLFGKHIPLFLVSVLLLLISLVYTVLLFTWQWLLYLPRWRIFNWSTNPKIQTFIETYHKPYTPKHRYWTGLLLIVRIILHLAAAINITNDPKLALTAISVAVCSIFALSNLAGSRLYRKWPVDILETASYFNILMFVLFTWYTLDGQDRDKEAVAYTSVSITFALLLLVVLYHVYTYTTLFSKLKRLKFCMTIDELFADTDPEKNRRLPHMVPPSDDDIHRFNGVQHMIDSPVNTKDYNIALKRYLVEPTQSVVEVHHPQLTPLDGEETLETQCTLSATS